MYIQGRNFKDYALIVFIFLANKRIVFDLNNHNIRGVPDGMTIDINGNLWIAVFGGHHVSMHIYMIMDLKCNERLVICDIII